MALASARLARCEVSKIFSEIVAEMEAAKVCQGCSCHSWFLSSERKKTSSFISHRDAAAGFDLKLFLLGSIET